MLVSVNLVTPWLAVLIAILVAALYVTQFLDFCSTVAANVSVITDFSSTS
jgi:hypothetical protein